MLVYLITYQPILILSSLPYFLSSISWSHLITLSQNPQVGVCKPYLWLFHISFGGPLILSLRLLFFIKYLLFDLQSFLPQKSCVIHVLLKPFHVSFPFSCFTSLSCHLHIYRRAFSNSYSNSSEVCSVKHFLFYPLYIVAALVLIIYFSLFLD